MDTRGTATTSTEGQTAFPVQAVPDDRALIRSSLTASDVQNFSATLDFAAEQVRRLIEGHPGSQPIHTDNGHWAINDDPWAPSWSGGFLTGMIWVFAARFRDSWWRQKAIDYCTLLEPRKDDPSTHDIGFLLEPSWGRWYDLEPTDRARNVLIDGGRTMANREQRPGGYMRTWVDAGSTFIDVMMNVGIVFRAAEYSGDRALYDCALRHTLTSRRHLQRGDGSTMHEGWFDVASGEFLRSATHQGFRSDSTWARGQAWAIYGFTSAYQHTHESEVLDSARRAADYYIAHTPSHGVPPNDFLEPDPARPYEASAGAIACSGLLHLSRAEPDGTRADRYRRFGLSGLRTLCSPEFLAQGVPGWEGVLRHASYHQNNGFGVDESLMFGDHYLVEALDTALGSPFLGESTRPASVEAT